MSEDREPYGDPRNDRPQTLTDAEAEDIRRGLADAMRGPVLVKWAKQLLADRTARVAWPPVLFPGMLAWCEDCREKRTPLVAKNNATCAALLCPECKVELLTVFRPE